MQHDFETTVAQTDIPQFGAARRYETKNLNESKRKRLPRKGSRLLRITTKNEDQTTVQNNGREAKISKEETRTLLTIDLGEVPLKPNRNSHQDPTLHIGTTIRILEDHMTKAQISHSKEAMETDLEMNLSTTRMKTRETMETFLVLHRPKGETSDKIFPIANQEVINLTTLLSADLKTDLRRVLRLTNTSSPNAIIRHHLMSFASPPLALPLLKYRTFAR